MIDSYGEEATVALLSSFSCVKNGVQKNEEVENTVALELYKKNGFVPFGERESESDGHRYIQLLKGF
jgi:hypothetical protein